MRRGKALSNVAPGLLLIAFGVLLAFATFFWNEWVDESSFTQASGVRENATVTNVDTEQAYSTYGASAATYLTVTLPTPVSGRTSAVAKLSYIANYTDGQVVAVLVNPGDPGHAELPGRPYAVWWQTVGLGLFAVYMLRSGVARIMRTAAAPARGAGEKSPETYDDDPPEIHSYFRQI